MNIHVGNLPPGVSEAEVEKLFSSFGRVAGIDVIVNVRTGEQMGYAFIIMQSDEEATHAIEGLNGKELNGKTLAVSRANRPSGQRTSSMKKRRKFR